MQTAQKQTCPAHRQKEPSHTCQNRLASWQVMLSLGFASTNICTAWDVGSAHGLSESIVFITRVTQGCILPQWRKCSKACIHVGVHALVEHPDEWQGTCKAQLATACFLDVQRHNRLMFDATFTPQCSSASPYTIDMLQPILI